MKRTPKNNQPISHGAFSKGENPAPIIFDVKKKKDRAAFARLRRSRRVLRIVDDLESEKQELALVRHPKRISHSAFFGAPTHFGRSSPREGVWVYYPWQGALVHVLEKRSFHTVRVSRNFNLILPAEQRKFEKFRIAIAGLNVGNPAALCIALEGGGQEMKFADNDVLTLSNLNRFRAGLSDLGLNKAVLSARQVYEIDPFAHIDVFDKGVVPGREDDFLLRPKADILVEEMDNLKLKISIRERARVHRIPVVMVTGNAENVIVDVERFDLDPRLKLLNGFLRPKVVRGITHLEPGKGTFRERVMLARDFMGAEYLAARLRGSFLQVGNKLAGIPQIAESSFLRGAAVCYVVRQIAIGAKMPSGRYALQLDSLVKTDTH